MLGFFGRFQKVFLIIAFLAIVASMAFFGTYSTLKSSEGMKKRYRSQSILNRAIDEGELRAIALFLEADAATPDNRGEPLFLLKSNWFSKNFLETKIAQEVIKNYASFVQKGLETKIAEHRNFKMYRHPTDPNISLEKSIQQFFPDFSEKYNDFMKGAQRDFSYNMDALFSLYRIASKVPMNWMKQILYYEQMQNRQKVEVDRTLEHRDINLFRAQKLSDWIGLQSVDLLSQWIYNTAVFARGADSYRGFKGYRVSLKEAESSLSVLIRKNIKRNAGQEKIEVSSDQMIERLAHSSGLRREELISGWQKIMLFRRFFHDVGNVKVDNEMFKYLIKGARIANLDTFEIDDALKSDSFYHVVKLDTYLNELSLNPQKKFESFLFHDLHDLEKMKSFLLAKRFKIKYATTTLNDASEEIGLNELFRFQISDKGFSFLQTHSRALLACKTSDQESRKSYLEKLEIKERARLENLCRIEMLRDQQALIRDLLVDQPLQPFEFYDTYTDKNQILSGVFDSVKLADLLEKSINDEKIRQALFCYSQDDQNYYRIELVEVSDKEILSFSKANELGILDVIVDKKLRNEYLKLRDQRVELKNNDKSFKTYSESKDFVASLTYSDLAEGILKRTQQKGIKLSNNDRASFLAKHYFDELVEKAYQKLKKDDFVLVKQKDPLAQQFSLKSSTKILRQSDKNYDENAFNSLGKGFRIGYDAFPYIYKTKSHEDDMQLISGARKEAKVMLANEAKMNAAISVLEKMLLVNVEIYDKSN